MKQGEARPPRLALGPWKRGGKAWESRGKTRANPVRFCAPAVGNLSPFHTPHARASAPAAGGVLWLEGERSAGKTRLVTDFVQGYASFPITFESY